MLLKKGNFMEYVAAREVMQKLFLDMLLNFYLEKKSKALWILELLEIQISGK